MDKIDFMLSPNSAPRDVYSTCVNAAEDMCLPRDTKQIRNMKHMKNRRERGDASTSNFADQLQYLSTIATHGDTFVRSVMHEHRTPSVLLYTDIQLDLVQTACCVGGDSSERSVLGIDRTFNLGEVYVTVII